jgi:lactoylglutathione lyase
MLKAFAIAAVMLSMGTATMGAEAEPKTAPSSSAEADHIALHVADQDKSVAFYQGAFGLAEIHAPVQGPRWFSLGGGMSLHLIGGRTAPLVTSKSVHLALRTRSLDPTVAYLKSKGLKWEDWAGNAGAITLRDDGVRQIFLQDPDGYWLEVNDALGSR